MRRYSMPVALLVAAAVVLLVAAAGQASGTSDTSLYLVQFTRNPLATYTGGVSGFSATKPAKGHRINTHTANAVGFPRRSCASRSVASGFPTTFALTRARRSAR